jgi:hypothetical protein
LLASDDKEKVLGKLKSSVNHPNRKLSISKLGPVSMYCKTDETTYQDVILSQMIRKKVEEVEN